jgi:hypothetical protein
MIPTAHHISAGCSKRPSRKAAASEEARRTLRYVESLSDARTMLAGFWSILLEETAFLEKVFVNNGSGSGGKLPTLL